MSMENKTKYTFKLINGEYDYIEAHKFCRAHRDKLINDKLCGCFYCLSIFSPAEIYNWMKDKKPADKAKFDEWMQKKRNKLTDDKFDEWIIDDQLTGLCPYCGIDSVIGESSGYPITKEFLEKMRNYWFKELFNPPK